jgi:hypothetical protein
MGASCHQTQILMLQRTRSWQLQSTIASHAYGAQKAKWFRWNDFVGHADLFARESLLVRACRFNEL